MSKKDRQVIFMCLVLMIILIYFAISVKSLEKENKKLINRVANMEKQLNETKALKEQLQVTYKVLDDNVKLLNNILKKDDTK